jgi:hypothetical protein
VLRLSSPGLSASQDEWRVEPVAGGYRDLRALIDFDGRVAGRVTEEEHRPGIPVRIELLPPTPEGGRQTFETTTGVDGQYEFHGVPPGRYPLGVNLWGKKASPAVPWPETSVPVQMGESQSIGDVNLTLPRRLRTRVIHVNARWAAREVGACWVCSRRRDWSNGLRALNCAGADPGRNDRRKNRQSYDYG